MDQPALPLSLSNLVRRASTAETVHDVLCTKRQRLMLEAI